jgi:hypothetical protein
MIMLEDDKLIMKEGRWQLMFNEEDKAFHGYYFIRHSCHYKEHNQKEYLRHWYFWRHFHQPCAYCNDLPPKSLQSLYVLLTDDMEPRYVHHG